MGRAAIVNEKEAIAYITDWLIKSADLDDIAQLCSAVVEGRTFRVREYKGTAVSRPHRGGRVAKGRTGKAGVK